MQVPNPPPPNCHHKLSLVLFPSNAWNWEQVPKKVNLLFMTINGKWIRLERGDHFDSSWFVFWFACLWWICRTLHVVSKIGLNYSVMSFRVVLCNCCNDDWWLLLFLTWCIYVGLLLISIWFLYFSVLTTWKWYVHFIYFFISFGQKHVLVSIALHDIVLVSIALHDVMLVSIAFYDMYDAKCFVW